MLESAGAHVSYGVEDLKTHTKLVLVVRQEEGKLRRYAHIGTGNYNTRTARIYTDVGLLTCDEAIGADISDMFNSLTGYSRRADYRRLLVAPVNMRQQVLGLIDRESGVHQVPVSALQNPRPAGRPPSSSMAFLAIPDEP